jgi:hypothetical protein
MASSAALELFNPEAKPFIPQGQTPEKTPSIAFAYCLPARDKVRNKFFFRFI